MFVHSLYTSCEHVGVFPALRLVRYNVSQLLNSHTAVRKIVEQEIDSISLEGGMWCVIYAVLNPNGTRIFYG